MTTMTSLNEAEELVVFGKGVGESILLRLKDEQWIVIDSFISPNSGKPVAVEYLETRGIDTENIIGIVCTHWDDDHIHGISDIISVHRRPLTVVLPIALKERRVKEYVYFNSDHDINTSSEFIKVLELRKQQRCAFCWAQSDRNLFGNVICDDQIVFKALSPNDEQYEEFLKYIVLPSEKCVKRGYSSYENSISVAVYVKTCTESFLLGGDLENSAIGGWEAVCNNYHESTKSHIFKVPHHGSESAYYEHIWTTLVDQPIAIITRFNRSHLPKDDMLQKIKAHACKVFVVGPTPKRDKLLMKSAVKYGGAINSVSILDYDYGYVRLYREQSNTNWCIETQGCVQEL